MAFILGLVAVALLAIYLDRRYHRICLEDERRRHYFAYTCDGNDTFALRREPDWNFPPKWQAPTGRTKA